VTEIVTNTRQKVGVVCQRGGGLHHLCFRCESVDAEVVRLEELGLRVVAPRQPGEAFEDERIAFLYAGDGLSIELIDTERRAGRLPGAFIG
jgi:methylmalonyl-CoA/ethylmalonyl-CoA epimerase